MKNPPLVKDYMATKLYTLKADESIFEAVDFLLKHKISGAPVVDDQDHLIGVISEKDCLKLLAKSDEHNLLKGTVGDFMSTTLTTLPPDWDIYTVAAIFLKGPFRRLPVITRKGKLIGQISRRDILHAIQDSLKSKKLTGDFASKAILLQKEDIHKITFPKGEVLASDEEIEIRRIKLENATRLGNIERHKVKIIFGSKEGIMLVHTTVWNITEKYISLKGGISIPICRIYEVNIL